MLKEPNNTCSIIYAWKTMPDKLLIKIKVTDFDNAMCVILWKKPETSVGAAVACYVCTIQEGK